MKLDSNNHSVFALHYHLVMCIKYRRKVINDSISDRLKDIFSDIRKYLWKEYFWSKSYCLVTTGGAPLEVVKQYIENQGK